ncbi:hypothetical protein METBIDRAFT_31822 [Metschnikowia bicuspidata var. bicuspidata NRRL YB-4993]|uniref:Uncharacterized protein n=1 Tax=Metschnikowia bicuspidata var. bicuspidata NRRL YB-4993 TaxID=869754 RepID=A0A1A0HBK0_9ASCO|nr:hypothetical protein METBIDRAFT_31822 [Metschnikowia bicuspidata var. bicuspidata NRRL YB-4993]OBA21263.1 hypothetical protein METBIDRAFT_31822 [Metschnikowia bicuspidata var. bicuspidata NRRL YB-4993]
MSEFKSYRKADLAKIAAKIGADVRSKDTKTSLLEKIDQLMEQHPERTKALLDQDDDLEVVTLVDEHGASTESEDDSEGKSADESADEPATISAALAADDKDYNAPPPINLKEWLVDPAIAAYKAAHDQVLQLTDCVGMTALECNDDLRESLSKTVSLNFLEAAVEASHFLYFYVPLVPVKDNRSVHQLLRDNIPCLNLCSWPVPDVTALGNFSVMSILASWTLFAVALPLLISYYVNFSRRVVTFETSARLDDDEEEEEEEEEEDVLMVIRAYKYDPFIFALSKVLIHYFLHKNAALTSIESYQGLVHAVKNLVYIQLGIYHTFLANLGSFPLVLGLANVVVALYSQFEDY